MRIHGEYSADEEDTMLGEHKAWLKEHAPHCADPKCYWCAEAAFWAEMESE